MGWYNSSDKPVAITNLGGLLRTQGTGDITANWLANYGLMPQLFNKIGRDGDIKEVGGAGIIYPGESFDPVPGSSRQYVEVSRFTNPTYFTINWKRYRDAGKGYIRVRVTTDWSFESKIKTQPAGTYERTYTLINDNLACSDFTLYMMPNLKVTVYGGTSGPVPGATYCQIQVTSSRYEMSLSQWDGIGADGCIMPGNPYTSRVLNVSGTAWNTFTPGASAGVGTSIIWLRTNPGDYATNGYMREFDLTVYI